MKPNYTIVFVSLPTGASVWNVVNSCNTFSFHTGYFLRNHCLLGFIELLLDIYYI